MFGQGSDGSNQLPVTTASSTGISLWHSGEQAGSAFLSATPIESGQELHSCTAVYFNEGHIESDTISLQIPRQYLVQHGLHSLAPFKSLRITSLLFLVAEQRESITSRSLSAIFNPLEYAPSAGHIEVATSRVPCFDGQMQSPAHGFRRLGLLSQIPFKMEHPETVLRPNADILTMLASSNHPATNDFINNWTPFGMTPSRHFIIIFLDTSSSRTAPHSRASSREQSPLLLAPDSSSRHHSPSYYGVRDPSTMDQMMLPVHGQFHDSIPDVPVLNPQVQAEANLQMISAVNNPELSMQLTCGLSLSDAVGIAHLLEERDAARYNSNLNMLFDLVKNFQALSHFLQRLGLKASEIDPEAKDSVTYLGGLKLKSSSIVTELGWALTTYSKKANAYGWAKKVADNMQWKADAVGEDTQNRKWLGIISLFGTGGFLDRNTEPSKSSNILEEICAAELKQTHIFSPGPGQIIKFLEPKIIS